VSHRVGVVMPLGEQRGGGELMLLHLLQQGMGQGIDWTVVFLREGPMVAQARELGARVHVINAGRMREVHRVVGTARQLARLARQESWSLILGWMGTGQLYGGLASLFSKVPAMWYQLAVPADGNWIDRLAVRLPAQRILTLSSAGLAAQKKLAPNTEVRLIYPGVELERFNPACLPPPAEMRRRVGLPEDVPVVGIVGRLQRWKGFHTFVNAFPNLLKSFPNAIGVIVGGQHEFEPEYETYVDDLIARQGLENSIRRVGLQKNVQEWMQAMDVVVHASEAEPFGIVIIEAMALGKPVVATDVGGPAEIITPGKNGLLTRFEDAEQLSKAIIQYLSDPVFAQQVGDAARTRAQDFSTSHYAHQVIAACREVIEGKN
jgi:Glycosyltransferase